MIELKINLRRYKQIIDKLNSIKIDSAEERRLYRKMYYWIKEKGWREAYFASHLRVHTGKLLNDTSFGKTGVGKYYFRMNAPHAKYIWWGTSRSRGRYIPKIKKRLRKDRLEELARRFGWRWVGWHPGVRTYKFPLRTNTLAIFRIYAKTAFLRWYDELIKGA